MAQRRPPPAPDLVTVGWAYGASDVALALSILEAAQLHPLPRTGNMVRNTWDQVIALGGTELCVPAPEAEELLAALAQSPARRFGWLHLLVFLAIYLYAGLPPPASGFVAVRSEAAAVRRIDPYADGRVLSH